MISARQASMTPMRGIVLVAAGVVLLIMVACTMVVGPGHRLETDTAFWIDANSGDDARSGRSAEQAWRTLAPLATHSLGRGTTVHLARGSQWPGPLVVDGSGADDAPLLVTAYGEGPLPTLSGGRNCVEVSGSRVVVELLLARACSWAGFEVSGDQVTIRRVEATGSAAGVVMTRTSSHSRILDSSIHDNNQMSVLTPTPTDDDSGAFGIALQGSHTEVARNTIAGHRAKSYDFGLDGSGIEVFDSSDNHVHHNRISGGDGVELGGKSARNLFTYNLITSDLPKTTGLVTRGPGDSTFGPVHDTQLINNTFINNGSGGRGVVCGGTCSGEILDMINNRVVAPEAIWADHDFAEERTLASGAVRGVQLDPGGTVAAYAPVPPGEWEDVPDVAVDAGVPTDQGPDLLGGTVPVDADADGHAMPDIGAVERQRPAA